MSKETDGWKKVVFAADCAEVEDILICPICKDDYSYCDCPGPHQQDEFEYREIKGILYAKPKEQLDLVNYIEKEVQSGESEAVVPV